MDKTNWQFITFDHLLCSVVEGRPLVCNGHEFEQGVRLKPFVSLLRLIPWWVFHISETVIFFFSPNISFVF